MGKNWKHWQILFSRAPKSLQMVTAAMKLKDACSLGRNAMTNLHSVLKSRDITLLTMWELDHKESWAPKNWWFRLVVLEKTLESPLDCKEIQPVHPKGNQSWIFIGRTDAEAPVLWPSDAKKWLTGKHPDAGQDWRQKGMTEDEMTGWHHWLDGHEFEQDLGVGDGEGSLACCSPWGRTQLMG